MLLLHKLLMEGGGGGGEKGLVGGSPVQGSILCLICHDLMTHAASAQVADGRGGGGPEKGRAGAGGVHLRFFCPDSKIRFLILREGARGMDKEDPEAPRTKRIFAQISVMSGKYFVGVSTAKRFPWV